jgi:glyoxylase-like metal-dependent hydrolase (beta-lactamase superfamily II)
MADWKIGDVSITRVIEVEIASSGKFILPDATEENIKTIDWLQPHFANEKGEVIMSVHALILEVGDLRLIVDTCIGNDKERSVPPWNMMQGPFLKDLQAAGYPRETINKVMCTHLHVDHVGWNTMLVDGQWVPTFPNARYMVAQKEFDYWKQEPAENTGGPIFQDSVKPIADAGLFDYVEMDHQICDEIVLEPTTGHTPGHVSVHITSKGEDALITGDFCHHPCQMAKPDWASSADFDQAAGRVTRHAAFEKYVDTPTLIIGTHFATPTAGHLVRDGDAYRLKV